MKILLISQILFLLPTILFSQWQTIRYDNTNYRDIFFFDSTFGCSVGDNKILITEDGGNSWQLREPFPSYDYYSVFFINKRVGWIAGASIIIKTTDSGYTWTLCENNVHTKWNDIFAIDSQKIWVVGNAGKLLYSQDGGNNWVEKNLNMQNNLTCIQFIDEDIGWIGADRAFLRTDTGGNNWTIFTPQPYWNIFWNTQDIVFLNKNIGYLVGPIYGDSNSTLFMTQNSGIDWEGIWSNDLPGDGGIYNLINIYFFDQLHGYALSGRDQGSLIIKTEDGGYNWSIDLTSFSRISVLNFPDKNNGWACGFGIILHGNIDVPVSIHEPIENYVPESIELLQNYPNPFNPTTTISYTINEKGFVQLKVYDVLGEEIANLVNEEKEQGSYSVKFDGNNLPSGIYFYSLRVNNFVQSRKMVLLR